MPHAGCWAAGPVPRWRGALPVQFVRGMEVWKEDWIVNGPGEWVIVTERLWVGRSWVYVLLGGTAAGISRVEYFACMGWWWWWW
jgi:hypothetical protein